jgi:hypothetical protein
VCSPCTLLPPTCPRSHSATLTLLPCLGDDFSCTLAHHLGDVQGAVSLVGDGDGTVHSFGLDLQRAPERENTPSPHTVHLYPPPKDKAKWDSPWGMGRAMME